MPDTQGAPFQLIRHIGCEHSAGARLRPCGNILRSMKSPVDSPTKLQEALFRIGQEAVPRILEGESLQDFCDWFCASMQAHLDPIADANGDDADHTRRLLLALARRFWSDIPIPALRWRKQTLPRLERNDRCYCGSGRKFKQCCAVLADLPEAIGPDHAISLVLATMDPAKMTSAQLRQIPPAALALAAMRIQQDHGDQRAADLLEPLFLDPAGLDGRHEEAFEILLDALLELGQERRRDHLVRAVSTCANKDLATSARCRRVTMLADRGEYEAAWALFHETQRFNPDDPQLLHLELVTLLAQGRAKEAQLRGPLLAAKARRLGHPELAEVLVALGRDGLAAIHRLAPADDELDDEERHWLALLNAAPDSFDEAHCRGLHHLERMPPMEGDDMAVLGIAPGKALAGMERRWRKRFPVEVPMLTHLEGDASSILEDTEAVQAFLTKHPEAWLSVNVLNDLLLAARQMSDDSQARALLVAARAMAAHAVAVCRALLQGETCRVQWGMQDSRAFLRVIAQAIEFARQMGDDEGAEPLMRWMLALNPNDNHGWRDLLVQRCLETDRAAEALQWLDRYPDDMPPAGHNRALALFTLGQRAAAEQALRSAHAESPRMVAALLPDLLDQPPDEGGPGIAVGGEMQAFYYRAALRPIWVRSGALGWLRSLELSAPAPKRTARDKPSAKAKKKLNRSTKPEESRASGLTLQMASAAEFSARDGKRLQTAFPDYERLRGYITAIAWSPDIVMPNTWLAPVMAMHRSARAGNDQPPSLNEMNAALGDLMKLYNHLNSAVLTQNPQGEPPVDVLSSTGKSIETDANAAVIRWAAGFVQGAEQCAAHWRKTGFAVNSDKLPFKALYALAAMAPATSEGWRPTNDEGQALLAGLELNPVPVRELLANALRPLWQAVAPIRQRRMQG